MTNELSDAKNRKGPGRPEKHPALARTVRFTVALSPLDAYLFIQARRCNREQPDDLGAAARSCMLEHVEDLKEKFAGDYAEWAAHGGVPMLLNAETGPEGPDLEGFERLLAHEAEADAYYEDPESPAALAALDRALAFMAEYRGKP